jgi:hypothetical protein
MHGSKPSTPLSEEQDFCVAAGTPAARGRSNRARTVRQDEVPTVEKERKRFAAIWRRELALA